MGAVEQCHDSVRVDVADDGWLAGVVVDDATVSFKVDYVLTVAGVGLHCSAWHELSDVILGFELGPGGIVSSVDGRRLARVNGSKSDLPNGVLSDLKFEYVTDGRPEVHVYGKIEAVHKAGGRVDFVDSDEDANPARVRNQRHGADDVAAHRKF